jgi:hypothetical protein
MVTDDCLDHLRDAVGRGVDVTVVATTDGTRERVETAVPGISIRSVPGERLAPLPGEHGRLGRLVVADRQAALVGARDGDERATTVDGVGHDLVTALRELAGSVGTDRRASEPPRALP